MEQIINNASYPTSPTLIVLPDQTSKAKPFIEANTVISTYEEIRNNHIIPAYGKTQNQYEPAIFQAGRFAY